MNWITEPRGSVSLFTASSNASGVLRAYNPSNLGAELYNSDQAGTRDTLGVAVKFSIPLVANGKVFVQGASELVIYGLLP